MPNKYSEMDEWSDVDVALFKESDELVVDDGVDILNRAVTASSGSSPNSLIVISEGDSWFDYKISADLIDCLRRYHGY